jgi:hypothetical protein
MWSILSCFGMLCSTNVSLLKAFSSGGRSIQRVHRCSCVYLFHRCLLKFSFACVILIQFPTPITEACCCLSRLLSSSGMEVFLLYMNLTSEYVPLDSGATDFLYLARSHGYPQFSLIYLIAVQIQWNKWTTNIFSVVLAERHGQLCFCFGVWSVMIDSIILTLL